MIQHQIAQSRQDGYWHILVKRDSLPHKDGIATGKCGIVGWHGSSKHVEEKKMCIQRHNIGMCAECMKVLMAESISMHY